MAEIFQRVAFHALIRNDEGKFLVTHRVSFDDHAPNVWDIPGGTAHLGEIGSKTVIDREIGEETRLKVTVLCPIFVYDFMSGSERHQYQIVYDCKYTGGEVVLNPEEHDEHRWVTTEELATLPMIAFLKALHDEVLIHEN